MKFSTKSKYGLKALVDLANSGDEELLSIKVIAERQNIPESYLEQLFSNLKKAKLVLSNKGPNGGYKLALTANEISVATVVRVLEGEMNVLTDKDRVLFQEDPLGYYINMAVWDEIDSCIRELLEGITLEKLKEGYSELTNEDSYMYFI